MKKIFYVLGKSATGKDTFYKEIQKHFSDFKTVIPYTTRPIRDGEADGVEYHFTTGTELRELDKAGKIIEMRTYQTIFGPWSYGTINDGQIDLERHHYLMIGTLESYCNVKDYFGEEQLVPLYIEVEDGERLARALERERGQMEPKYAELCRRFLADEEDFSEERLIRAGIAKRYENTVFERCLAEILDTIHHYASI